MNASVPPSILFRRALLVLLSAEVVFLLGVISAGLIFGIDANGGRYWKESVQIASFVLVALALPALVLAYAGKSALLAAAPLAAIATAICLFPYMGFVFDLSAPTLLKLAVLIVLLAALYARMRTRRKA
jgi:hypothetical protein